MKHRQSRLHRRHSAPRGSRRSQATPVRVTTLDSWRVKHVVQGTTRYRRPQPRPTNQTHTCKEIYLFTSPATACRLIKLCYILYVYE